MEGLKSFDTDNLKPIFETSKFQDRVARRQLKLEEETAQLDGGRALSTSDDRRKFATLARREKAAELIGHLPARGETLHVIISGECSPFDLVTAAVEIAGQPIDQLVIATLGFSKDNVAGLSDLVDAGQVRHVVVICANYFKSMDKEIYAQMSEFCQKHSFPMGARRTHAKILMMAIGQNRYVLEGSANLRACHSVEQVTMFNDAELFDWHLTWINELLEKGSSK